MRYEHFLTGEPPQLVPFGKDSPFITKDKGSMLTSLPTSLLYKMMQLDPIEVLSPILILPTFITRSSKRCVCGPQLLFNAASSPIFTISNSVISVVLIHASFPIFTPKKRKKNGNHGVPFVKPFIKELKT